MEEDTPECSQLGCWLSQAILGLCNGFCATVRPKSKHQAAKLWVTSMSGFRNPKATAPGTMLRCRLAAFCPRGRSGFVEVFECFLLFWVSGASSCVGNSRLWIQTPGRKAVYTASSPGFCSSVLRVIGEWLLAPTRPAKLGVLSMATPALIL